MKIVLLQNIKGLGEEGDIKEVADGYARNFLLPRNMAKAAIPEAIAEVEAKKAAKARVAEKELGQIQGMASQLDGHELEVQEKVSEGGKLFASINEQKIVKLLHEKGFDVNKNQVVLKEPIKEPGEYEVNINLEHGLEAQIKVIVSGATG